MDGGNCAKMLRDDNYDVLLINYGTHSSFKLLFFFFAFFNILNKLLLLIKTIKLKQYFFKLAIVLISATFYLIEHQNASNNESLATVYSRLNVF